MEFKDQLGNSFFLQKPPQRIISLVPSQTELLIDLGLVDRLVGVTKFCIHPTYIKKEKAIIGGTKNYRFDVIQSLNPDLIIGNKEENEKEGIEKLMEDYPVWMSDIFNLEDSLSMIRELGSLLDVKDKAESIASRIAKDFENPIPFKGTAVYLIWDNPIMTAGQGTFINVMLKLSGFNNLVQTDRYPQMEMEDIKELNPEYLLLSSEPFPFKEKHVEIFKSHFPNTQILLVDGEMFSWYGSRLLKSRKYFESL
ncbi:ABC transporter substrate-binding protein [Algoriphagus zhangzhouensis]|uniref:ABC-type Fe3+-hydroxamate transport system, substrate-binding protein n=1 Tax=Algoriphagus zhangzhouensis TaxID=1073327 RepID=A0A1M7ZGV3_9BACT|nr:helical backbone metal receptor [Algoriphagus zhangzhouensis]TDY44636.1 ABC-type Fe3+-hydroxamate transport system substrate-binding protein [Algoriphagus zhangzhouensis]SHO64072.1 ABC-type Fe3+-hydroxamate transport system, substrate-binding protein [Algoriphagus zhangzhouensis]